MSDTSKLQENLKEALKTRKMTAADLARVSGVSLATLSRVLSGQVNPSFGNMVKISEALNMSLDQLAGHAKPQLRAIENKQTTPEESVQKNYANETDVLVSYMIDKSDLEPADAARMLVHAANGAWTDTWAEKFINPDAYSKVRSIIAMQFGKKIVVDLAFPDAYFESGSIASLVSVAGSACAGTSAKIMDIRIPTSLIRTFANSGKGVDGVRYAYRKSNRPLLCATIRPMVGVDVRFYAQMIYDTLAGGVDLTCDPTMMHNIPYNEWYGRLPHIREACDQAQEARDGEDLDHILNISAPTVDEMIKRAERAMELGFSHFMVDSMAIGWSALQSVTGWAKSKGVLIAAMGSRSLQTVAFSEQVLAKLLRFSGCDVISTPSPLNNNIGGRRQVRGMISSLRDENIIAEDDLGITFDQPTLGLHKSMPACGGGHNPWHFPTLVDTMGNDTIIQCGGTVFSHPKGPIHGAAANRAAIEALVRARSERKNLSVEGRQILAQAAEDNEDLAIMLDQWKEGAFLFGVVKNKNVTAEVKPLTPKN